MAPRPPWLRRSSGAFTAHGRLRHLPLLGNLHTRTPHPTLLPALRGLLNRLFLNPDADMTGMPAASSLFTVQETTASTWIRRDCDDAVLAFVFTTSEVARIKRDSKLIAL
jgi:hypothetical protein